MIDVEQFTAEHELLTRRHILRMGVTGAAIAGMWPTRGRSEPTRPELAEAIAKLEPYFTALDQFRDVLRGNPAAEGVVDLPNELTAGGAQDLFVYNLPKLTLG